MAGSSGPSFIDEVEIDVAAGAGGNGMATFRREKYVPRGGPSGGDGGRGGSVCLVVDTNLTTLVDFRLRKHYKADRGGDGGSKDMFGHNAADLVLKVPAGTTVTDVATGELLADLSAPTATYTVARGGVGGKGNAHFANSVHQAPRFAEKGEPGEARRIRLELKSMADVGLLGFPNAGKSTLISAVSAARPQVAAYPFTTLVPHLGVVRAGEGRSFVMADIPGIIEGAAEGAGLGHRFLRHVERTRLLVHVLDAGGLSGREPMDDFRVLNRELARYDKDLARVPQIVALNKMDLVVDTKPVDRLAAALRRKGFTVHRISAATRAGLEPLVYDLMERLEALRKDQPAPASSAVVYRVEDAPDPARWTATRSGADRFEVHGYGVERLVAMTDLGNEHGIRRLQRQLDRMGVTGRLKALGARGGDTVQIRDIEFDYVDEDAMDGAAVPGRRRR